MRVLVMGCGELGALIATALLQDGHQVSVMDAAVERLRRLPEELQHDAVLGDGAQEDDLLRAGIEARDAFIAVTADDIDNIFAAQMAQHVFQVERVVCRIDDAALCAMYSELGLDAVSAAGAASVEMLRLVNG